MKEFFIAIVSAVVSSVVTWFFTLKSERRKEQREDALAFQREQREAFRNRPEMSVVELKNYLSRPGYGIKQKCDIELFVPHIDHVSVESNNMKGRRKREWVLAHFHPEDLNTNEWCCVIYVFKNMGKTDISTMDIICHYQKDTCIFPCDFVKQYMNDNILKYSECYDKKFEAVKR